MYGAQAEFYPSNFTSYVL